MFEEVKQVLKTAKNLMNRIFTQFGVPFPFNMLELDTDIGFSKGAMMVDINMIYS